VSAPSAGMLTASCSIDVVVLALDCCSLSDVIWLLKSSDDGTVSVSMPVCIFVMCKHMYEHFHDALVACERKYVICETLANHHYQRASRSL